MPSYQHVIKQLRGDQPLLAQHLDLCMGSFRLRLRSNSSELLSGLRKYFKHLVCSVEQTTVELTAIECPDPELELGFTDWRRETGKQGRKDSYIDMGNVRILHKVRTGMVFVQSAETLIAAGRCIANDNQVINFIINQYMSWLQRHNWVICHAAAVGFGDRALGLAGFSGGGKSTLMLHLMDNPELKFISNDRLFIRPEQDKTKAVGVPKLPRINPGTIVHNPRLAAMLPRARRDALLALPTEELWQLEEKYDADLEQLYGAGSIESRQLPLDSFVVLNWQRDSGDETRLTPVDLSARGDLLAAIVKSPGPFYQRADGSFNRDDLAIDPKPYLDALANVKVYEACGRTDFVALRALIARQILR